MQETPTPVAVREQLERLTQSEQLGRSKRLLRFLSFTIDKTLQGHADELTEHAIGTTVYDRPSDFDSAVDGIVRTELHRLRAKLDSYYSHQGHQDPITVAYPMGSYVPQFQFAQADFLPKIGKVSDLIRAIDWGRTPLGPIAMWPRTLKTALSICLSSRYPMTIYWGPEFLTFPNDASYDIVKTTHPNIVGRPGSEGPTDWGRLSAILSGVMKTAEPHLLSNSMWLMDRLNFREELYFTSSFSQIRNDEGIPSGVMVVYGETTRAVVAERRLKTLIELAERSTPPLDALDACRFAASVFEKNPYDIPFTSIYLYDEARQKAILRAVSGVEPGMGVSSPSIMSPQEGSLSLLAEAAFTGKRQILKVEGHLGLLPTGAWRIPPNEIAILPLPDRNPATPSGFIMAGINPHRPFDADYGGYLEVLAARLGGLIQYAQRTQESELRIREADELQALTTSFLAKAGDAIRTPLTILLGLLSEVLQSKSLDDDQRRKLTMACRNAVRLEKEAGDVLNFAAGRSTMLEETVLPVYTEEAFHWTEEKPTADDPMWQHRQLVTEIRRRILVVSADEDFHAYLKDLLSELYAVDTVANAAEAAVLLTKGADLLVLADSGANGDMTALIRAIRSDRTMSLIPIIMLSAQGSWDRRFRTLASGVDDYLVEPFSAVEFMARIRSQLTLADVRKKIVQQQVQSQAPLNNALDQIPAGIMVAEVPSGAIVFTNETLTKMFGDLVFDVTNMDNIPENIGFFADGSPLLHERCPLIRSARYGEVVCGEEILYKLPNGRSFKVRSSSRPILDGSGHVIAALMMLEDVSA